MPSVVLRVPLRFTMNDVNEMLAEVNGLAPLRITEWKEMVRGFVFQDIVDDILDDINTGSWNGDLASYRAEIETAITDYRVEKRNRLEAERIQRRDIRRLIRRAEREAHEQAFLEYQIEVLSTSDGDSIDD